jgi:serine O-acetyltransferase
MIISAVSSYKNFSYKGFSTRPQNKSLNHNTNFLAEPKTPKKSNAKKVVKWLTIGLSTITTGLMADLFLAKGKVSSTLTRGKVSFIKNMAEDIDNVLQKDSYATKNKLEAFLSVPGLHAVWNHRIIHKLHNAKIPVLPRVLANASRFLTGIEIHPGAEIGKKLFIDHTGAIIGETAKIGDDVTLIGHVVLGSTGKGEYLRHTIVEDGVTLGMNSTMLGRITLGKNSKIGAGALVTHDVPRGATIIGNPAKIIALDNEKLKHPITLTKDSIKYIEAFLKNKNK